MIQKLKNKGKKVLLNVEDRTLAVRLLLAVSTLIVYIANTETVYCFLI